MNATRIRLDALEGVDKWIINRDDEAGGITLVLATEDWQVDIRLGRTEEDAANLHSDLVAITETVKRMVDDWVDMPDDYDAFVVEDMGRYYVNFEQVHLDQRGFPTKDIAMYELAEHMAAQGAFPAAWFQYSAYTVSIDDEVRAFHDDGGDAMRPLAGVQYEHGDTVEVNHRYQTGPSTWVRDWERAEVIRDYGELGLHYGFYGLDEDYVELDRNNIRPAPAEDDEE